MLAIAVRGLACALLLAACATDTGERETGDHDSVTVVVPNAPVRADTIGGSQTAIVNVLLDEWSITVPSDTLPAGATQFVVMNRGDAVHGIEVEGASLEEEVENIRPGVQATLTLQLVPGAYEVYCPVQDSSGSHRALGMTRRIVVR